MHHAVQARDIDTVIEVGPNAGREAALAGSHRQALAHYESVLPHEARLGLRERADLLDSYGWELYNALRFRDAVEAGREAAELYQELGDPVAYGSCLVRLSRHLFMAGETDAAEERAHEAVAILEPTGDAAALAHASLYDGAVLALTDDPELAAPILEHARELALRAGRPDFAALALNYLGIARVEIGDPGGLQLLRESIREAMDARQYEYAARGYCNLIELLARGGHLDELEIAVAEGLRFARERGFWSHAYNLEVHRCIGLIRRGGWDAALAGLQELVDSMDDPGMLHAYSVPWLGRLLARRGDPSAGPMLADAWERARSERLLLGITYAGLGYVEWAWLAGAPDVARGVATYCPSRGSTVPARRPFRSELLRYLARAGLRRARAAVARRRRSLRAGRRPRLLRRPGRDRRGRPDPRQPRRGSGGRARPRPPAGHGRARSAGPSSRDARQPRRAHRAPAGGAGAGERRADERGDRGPAGGVRAHRRPSRGRGAGEARRALAARSGRRGARHGDRL